METTNNQLNSKELEFAIFCIENVAAKLGMNAKDVYNIMTQQTNVLYGYIVPSYDALHTQGKEYIVDDVIYVMKEMGAKL